MAGRLTLLLLIVGLLTPVMAVAERGPSWLLDDERNTIDVFSENAESVVFIRDV